MEKRELEVMWNFYYCTGVAKIVWIDFIDKLDIENKIKKIYQVIDKEYNDSWFLVIDDRDRNYLLKTRHGLEYSIVAMSKYKGKYEFYKISTDLIKIYGNGIYPIVFKLNEEQFNRYYHKEENLNSAFFNNYILYDKGIYKTVRDFRNKIEYEEFENKYDAIQWCISPDLSKDNLIIKKNNLENYIYDYEF